MAEPFQIKLVGKDAIPDFLQDAMRRNGVDPRSTYVASADGWRYGDPEVDLSAAGEVEETLKLALEAVEWLETQLEAAPEDLEPAAAVLELNRPDWLGD